jgi:transmembrane sensor
MDSEAENGIRTAAIEWHIRLRDGDDGTWEAFADWLAADTRHAHAYDEIEQTDLAIEPLLPKVTFRPDVANDVGMPVGRPRFHPVRWGVAGGILAASIVAAIAVGPLLASSRYEVVTGPGQHQVVTLDGTAEVTLNGSTHMIFDHKDPRFAALATGEALFRIRHDAARPFRLTVGDKRVEDVGTVFDVVSDATEIRVAVAEGGVVYRREGKAAISLDAGQALVDRTRSGAVRMTQAQIASVGAWQNGRLIYSGEPLSQVGGDLARSLGIRIAVSSSVADRPFSGTIVLDSADPEQLRRLAPALDVTLESGPDGWMMLPAGRAER